MHAVKMHADARMGLGREEAAPPPAEGGLRHQVHAHPIASQWGLMLPIGEGAATIGP
jgi:hypothetical protein